MDLVSRSQVLETSWPRLSSIESLVPMPLLIPCFDTNFMLQKRHLTANILYPPFPPKCLYNHLYYWQALFLTLPSTLLSPAPPPSFVVVFFLTKQIHLCVCVVFFFFFKRGMFTQDCSVVNSGETVWLHFLFTNRAAGYWYRQNPTRRDWGLSVPPTVSVVSVLFKKF